MAGAPLPVHLLKLQAQGIVMDEQRRQCLAQRSGLQDLQRS